MREIQRKIVCGREKACVYAEREREWVREQTDSEKVKEVLN